MDEALVKETGAEAKALADIVSWSRSLPLPDWQQDALRRLYRSESLSDSDLDELLPVCKGETSAEPVTADHIRDPAASNAQVTLKRLEKLEHVNALKEGQVLSFEKIGLTVVYGDNGAGKSGYARVLKQACRARLPSGGSAILPNVYDGGSGTPQADIVFRVGGQSRRFSWQEGTARDPELTAVSVFDSQTANVHVDKKNDLAYTPAPLKILEELAKACQTLKEKLTGEIGTLENQTPAVLEDPKCARDTEAGKLLSEISATTKPQTVEELAGLDEAEAVELRSLASDLATDPVKAVQGLQAIKSEIEAFVAKVKAVQAATEDQQIRELIDLKSTLKVAKEAASLASTKLFSREPLPEVGSETWRKLWEAARSYSEAAAYRGQDFPVTDDEARCVLCHQKLTPEASERLKSFENFVHDETGKREKAAKEAYTEKLRQMCEQQLSTAEIERVVALVRDRLGEEAVAERLRKVAIVNAWRLRSILKKHESEPECDWPKAEMLKPEEIDEVLHRLSKRISGLTAKADSPERQSMIARRNELEARKWLDGVKDDVLAQIMRLKEIAKLEKAQKTTATNRITAFSKDLAKSLVTDRLKQKFAEEIADLGAERLEVRLEQAKSAAGVTFFHVRLKSKSDAPVGKVLSEGEHRCVALAAFLAELATAGAASAIVFDDPVSSFDHFHREKVAKRLARESLERQVVVFTHDIAFVVLIEEASRATEEQAKIPIGYRLVSRGSDAPGFCHNERPMKEEPVENAVERMRQHLKNVKIDHERGDQTKWDQAVRQFAQDLRKAWERAVEDIVSPVIRRLDRKVKTNGLVKLTVIEKNDCTTMREAYRHLSPFLHNQPEELDPQPLTPNDIEQEIKKLEDWVSRIQERQKTIK
ncbi:MAG: AAA family ATPase [Rhodospirillales bacterium]|nr:AAA family ATPase [Rhodospirillales bacterium]